MKKLVNNTFALTMSAICLLSTSLSVTAAPNKVDILISPSGSGPYLAWATMQNYASDYTDKIAPTAVETPGFTYNVRYLASSPQLWKNTIIGSGQVVEWAAKKGISPFFPKPMEAVNDFRALGVMSRTSNMFVTLDPSIKSKDDFIGKRVAVGLLTQNEWGMHQRMMLDGWGITKQLKSFDALGPAQNINAVLDGKADIGTLVTHSNRDFSVTLQAGPFKTLESSGRDYTFIDINKEDIQSYIDKTGAPFSIQVLPANTVANQPKPVTSFGNYTLLSVHKSFPEEDAYEMTKLWLQSGIELGKYSAVAKIWDKQTLATIAKIGLENIHPGALRAYKELGLID
ncbi:TAXI family TRAP transporter solute-binding subunit [Psychromonas sp. L1A2]|uniref:TAXI family TRAP transporter solute-binding subunit n=1 Tax=Psychromonas sp. L1A2 TaxID=2686356 RepID=UPI00135A8D93|nr:TAXI family TRAP transporter solute-binding subunit [Psychromonas sp. L1A2]